MKKIIAMYVLSLFTFMYGHGQSYGQSHEKNRDNKIILYPFHELDSLLIPLWKQRTTANKKYIYAVLEKTGDHIYRIYIDGDTEKEIEPYVKHVLMHTNRYIQIGTSLIPVYLADYDYEFKERSPAVFPMQSTIWEGITIQFDMWNKKIIR